MSTLAFFVAVGGVGYAAATINSADVVDNSLRSADLKDDKAVKTADIVDGSLTGADVLDGSLSGGDIGGSVAEADAVDGYSVRKVFETRTTGINADFLTPADGGGLQLQFACGTGPDATIFALTDESNAVIQEGTVTGDNTTAEHSDDNFGPGGSDLFTFEADDRDQVTFTYADQNGDATGASGSTVVTGALTPYELPAGGVGNNNIRCLLVGTLWIDEQ
ncbi:MAG: hypothetical protein ACR2G3_11915 [Solirubrobacterales bacterium]